MISLDTETTGVDLRHGAKPFYVVSADDSTGEVTAWEWDVDPLTREPVIPEGDIDDLAEYLSPNGTGSVPIILQNSKFDVAALASLRPEFGEFFEWQRVRDTLISGHMLASNRPKDLTSMAVQYVGVNIQPYEDRLEKAVQECRRYCRTHLPTWAIAKEGRPDMPSAKAKTWKFDTWLPRAVIKHRWETSEAGRKWNGQQDSAQWISILAQCRRLTGFEFCPPDVAEIAKVPTHWYWTVLRDYANCDAEVTLLIEKVHARELKARGLEAIYRERLKVLPIAFRMESRGVTLSGDRLGELTEKYVAESEEAGRLCLAIAKSCDYDLVMPKGASPNRSLRTFVLDVLKLPPIRGVKAKTDEPTLNKAALDYYEQLTSSVPFSKAAKFVKALRGKRSRDTGCAYMEGYKRFWKPLGVESSGVTDAITDSRGFFVLHPSLNPTGTDTLRWSSSQPNEQNISKREGFNLRYCFGPAPRREWWSLDAKNIELRIPAYESGEQDFIDLFEKPDDPPYFGSNHLLISHLLFPQEFNECRSDVGVDGRVFKRKYAATLYQRVKNGNFAVQYGAVDRADGLGTADRTYGIKGAQAQIAARFAKQDALNRHWIRFAEKHGYVETMPDRSVDPSRGYPLLCSRTERGRIKPTVPLNYHVQGTAMWWTMMGMIRVQDQLDAWREETGFDGRIVMQVHDELVLDFPKSRRHPKVDAEDKTGVFRLSNLWRIRRIQKLMEKCGEDIGVPTPVGCEYHEVSWDEGVTL